MSETWMTLNGKDVKQLLANVRTAREAFVVPSRSARRVRRRSREHTAGE